MRDFKFLIYNENSNIFIKLFKNKLNIKNIKINKYLFCKNN